MDVYLKGKSDRGWLVNYSVHYSKFYTDLKYFFISFKNYVNKLLKHNI